MHRNNLNDDTFVFDDAKVLHRQQCGDKFGEWLERIMEFAAILRRMEIDLSAFACISAMAVFSGEFVCFINIGRSDRLRLNLFHV